MEPSFTFTIRDQKYKGYHKIASLLFIINAVFFISLGISADTRINQLMLFGTSTILLGYSIYHWKFKAKGERSYFFIYALIMLAWITQTGYPYFSLFYLLLMLLQYRMENDLRFSFTAGAVAVDRLFTNTYQWSAFNNIILKDGLLTLDFQDNRIMQVEPDLNTSTDNKPMLSGSKDYGRLEREFNDFCKEQLRK